MNVEVVRGRVEGELAERVLRFWSDHGALSGAAARERLGQVVCTVTGDDGAIVGVNSVYDDRVPLIGNRRFWLYRRFLAPGVPEDVELAMLNVTFDALAAERRASTDGPVGLCFLVADRVFLHRHPEAEWPETQMFYAGYLADGRQVRIRYFEEVSIL